jgi:hypothetical protein
MSESVRAGGHGLIREGAYERVSRKRSWNNREATVSPVQTLSFLSANQA